MWGVACGPVRRCVAGWWAARARENVTFTQLSPAQQVRFSAALLMAARSQSPESVCMEATSSPSARELGGIIRQQRADAANHQQTGCVSKSSRRAHCKSKYKAYSLWGTRLVRKALKDTREGGTSLS